MSTLQNADQARKMIDEIAALKRDAVNDPARAESIWDRIEALKGHLRDPERPKFEELTEGLIASTLNPMMPQHADSMSQGADPRSRAS